MLYGTNLKCAMIGRCGCWHRRGLVFMDTTLSSFITNYFIFICNFTESTALYENRKYNCLSLKKTILFFSRTNCLKVCVRYFRWSIWMSAFPLQHISNQYRTIIGRYFETVWGLKVSNPFKKRLYQQYSAYSLYENLRKQMQFKLF